MAVSTAPPGTSTALAFVITNVVMALLMMAVVWLRFLARFRFTGLGWNDIFALLGSICALILVGLHISAYCMGAGNIVDSVQLDAMQRQLPTRSGMENMSRLLLHTFVFNIFYIIGLGATKMSVLLFLVRVVSSRPLRLACQTGVAMMAVWTIAFGLAVVFVCTPVSLQWDLSLDGACGSRIGIYKALIYSSIVFDLGIILLPSYEIWHLKFGRLEKVGLAVAFFLGFGAIVSSCARLTTVGVMDRSGDFAGTVDGKFYFLAALEVVLGVAAVSIPALRPLYCRCEDQSSSSRLCQLIRGGSSGGNDLETGAELGRVHGRKTEGVEKGITVETEFVLSSYRTTN